MLLYFLKIPVDTIESTFGEIPNKRSMPSIPNIDFATVQQLIQPAFAIALLGGIESLLSAVVGDGMIGRRHRSNVVLFGQGAANCMSPWFGGRAGTGWVT